MQHVRIQKVLSEGVGLNSDSIFLANEEREDSNTTKSQPSLAHQRRHGPTLNAFCWQADNCPLLNAGLVAS